MAIPDMQSRFTGRIPALGRGRASYFSLMKSNQKSSQQKCFFTLLAIALQSGQNHGLLNLTSTSFAHYPPLQVRFAMPLQPHKPSSFCPLSPEAYLLTGEEKRSYFSITNSIIKQGKHILKEVVILNAVKDLFCARNSG
ncbi:hypothetical protein [Mucilaginibacter sp. SG564]|uniref:hypothetical protein n=1 Tax=Mucilaginibacter sp. SG564 TaxID=2587022 RepID=UPI0015531556|nr:hypothetical protein [Mucilaginibacter sp. SG564]